MYPTVKGQTSGSDDDDGDGDDVKIAGNNTIYHNIMYYHL